MRAHDDPRGHDEVSGVGRDRNSRHARCLVAALERAMPWRQVAAIGGSAPIGLNECCERRHGIGASLVWCARGEAARDAVEDAAHAEGCTDYRARSSIEPEGCHHRGELVAHEADWRGWV